MIGCLRTRVRKQPIIALYFESEYELKLYNLEAWTQIQSISRYSDHGVRGTIYLSIIYVIKNYNWPFKSGHSSICSKLHSMQWVNEVTDSKFCIFVLFLGSRSWRPWQECVPNYFLIIVHTESMCSKESVWPDNSTSVSSLFCSNTCSFQPKFFPRIPPHDTTYDSPPCDHFTTLSTQDVWKYDSKKKLGVSRVET